MPVADDRFDWLISARHGHLLGPCEPPARTLVAARMGKTKSVLGSMLCSRILTKDCDGVLRVTSCGVW